MQYKSLLKILLLSIAYKSAIATGMAVGLDNLLIQNNTSEQLNMEINNLPKDKRQIIVKPHSACILSEKMVFFPASAENNSFAIMLKNSANMNAIVIDKDGRLALASNAYLKFNYHGNVKQDKLLGYCDNKLQQSKFLAVNPESLKDSMPVFKLKGCNKQSNFVYVVNKSNTSKSEKLNINNIPKCSISR